MKPHFGAMHDLGVIIKTHLFVLCPNNSGSSFLINAIGRTQGVWSLRREGQHVAGFSGPSSRISELPLIWGACEESRARFTDAGNYDWEKTKKAWYFQATARNPAATIFATKAPPFLLIPDLLVQNFVNTKFIVMLRNPYAMAEGIIRRNQPSAEMTADIALHVINCFKKQVENIEQFSGHSVFFTYEDMCEKPKETMRSIQSHVPGLTGLRFDLPVPVKGLYVEPATNFNEQQIARLSDDQITELNKKFEKHTYLFEQFGYQMLSVGQR